MSCPKKGTALGQAGVEVQRQEALHRDLNAALAFVLGWLGVGLAVGQIVVLAGGIG